MELFNSNFPCVQYIYTLKLYFRTNGSLEYTQFYFLAYI